MKTTRSALARWRALPAYQDARRRHAAGITATVEAELATGRLAAVRALRRIVEGGTAEEPVVVEAAELSSAARALLTASAPPGELTRQRAARDARGEWLAAIAPESPEVRTRILARVEGSMDELPVEELKALGAR